MRRAIIGSRIWSILALATIGAAGLLSLRSHPGGQPASLARISKTGASFDALRPMPPSLVSDASTASARLSLQTPSPAARARLVQSYGKLPITFVRNRGQLDRRVAYYVPGRDKSLYFTAGGVTFALAGKSDRRRPTTDDGRPVVMPTSFAVGASPTSHPKSEIRNPKSKDRWALKLEFVGARPGAEPEGREASPTVVSYFRGPQSEWQTGIRTCASVAYNELWPGIDLVYSGSYARLKYTFEVKPGADPQQIRLAYHGASALALAPEGGLAISTPAGGFTDDRPIAYQEIDGKRVPIEASYVLDEPTASTLDAQRSTLSPRGYHFRLGAYDHRRPLEIDPVVVVYGAFIGGDGDDIGTGIAVDSAGNTYITGSTGSDDLPVKVGPNLTWHGHDEVFVAKLNPAGNALVYLGYIGGSDDDDASGIAIDSAGNAYVTGVTYSSNFPTTVGPSLKSGGGADAFIAKVSADGTKLLYSGYIGGSGDDEGQSIAVDSAGNAYVAGFTNSSNLPTKVGPSLKNSGGYDAFVVRVNAAGTGFDYAGYIGGSGFDAGYGIAVDSAGNAYVTGSTTSSESSFPVRGGPGLTYKGAGGGLLYAGVGAATIVQGDAFVAKVKPDGSGLVYAGYIGGSSDDMGTGIAVDSAGSAYIGGVTASSDLPVKVGPSLSYRGGLRDGFVAKVTPDGTGLVYAGYVGGSLGDDIYGIAVNSAGNAYLIGRSQSADTPTFRGPQTVMEVGTWFDVLVGEVKSDGTGFVYLSFMGTNSNGGSRPNEAGLGVAVDGAGNTYITGRSEFGIPTVFVGAGGGSLQTRHSPGNDVLISKLVTQDLVTLALSAASAAPGTKVTATATLDAPAPAGGEVIRIASDNRAVATPDADTVTIPAGKTSATFTVTTAAAPPSQNVTITVYDDTSPSKPQTLTVK